MTTSNHTSEIPYGYCHCGCGQKTSIAQINSVKLGYVKGEPVRYIKTHYSRQAAPILKRFWSKVAFTANPNKCWEWQAGKTKYGYGELMIKNKQVYAHRLSWELTYGEIPDGLFVCHKCDNPKCVNPNHLFLGTNLDNVRDMVSKGRNKLPNKSFKY